jgi:hypothetical protein
MELPTQNAITLRLRNLSQLFNSMDPSPFIERDLDADAEEFIVSWARELPAGRELELVIQLAEPASVDRLAGLEDAVRAYFESRAEMKRRELGQLMRRGRLSLGVGLLFLAGCLMLGQFIARSGAGTATDIIREGLTIGGWVAMWRPLEIYLYDWWPLFEEQRRLERLARIKVRIVAPAVTLTTPGSPETESTDEIESAAA